MDTNQNRTCSTESLSLLGAPFKKFSIVVTRRYFLITNSPLQHRHLMKFLGGLRASSSFLLFFVFLWLFLIGWRCSPFKISCLRPGERIYSGTITVWTCVPTCTGQYSLSNLRKMKILPIKKAWKGGCCQVWAHGRWPSPTSREGGDPFPFSTYHNLNLGVLTRSGTLGSPSAPIRSSENLIFLGLFWDLEKNVIRPKNPHNDRPDGEDL